MMIWYGAGAVAAIGIAWLASLVYASGHAPIGLVSLGVGAALGATFSGIAASLRIAGLRRLVIGTILLAILAVFAEHTWLYLDFRRQWHEAREKSPQMALFRPETPWSPAEFFANEATPSYVTFWCIDAVIIIASATTTLFILHRRSSHSPPPSPQPPAPSP